MPTGLKESSSVVAIGFEVEQAAANDFAQDAIDLNLSPLDREVFVVLAINMDPQAPDAIDGTDTSTETSLTTTQQEDVQNLSNANCLATARLDIRAGGFADSAGVGFSRTGFETPPTNLEYIGIIATNDFFVQIGSRNNAGVKKLSGKLYGYRAVASADIYAALVQSEVLSA